MAAGMNSADVQALLEHLGGARRSGRHQSPPRVPNLPVRPPSLPSFTGTGGVLVSPADRGVDRHVHSGSPTESSRTWTCSSMAQGLAFGKDARPLSPSRACG